MSMRPRGRPRKNLSVLATIRVSDEERYMVETLRDMLGCGLNDALRVCIRRGWARVESSPEIDGPVLDPDWKPAPPCAPPVPKGQMQLPTTTDETPEQP